MVFTSRIDFFVGLTISPVEAPKLAKFWQVNDNDSVFVTDLRFLAQLCILSYSPLSNGVPFSRKFFVRHTVSALQGLQFTHPICATTFSVLLGQDIGEVENK